MLNIAIHLPLIGRRSRSSGGGGGGGGDVSVSISLNDEVIGVNASVDSCVYILCVALLR